MTAREPLSLPEQAMPIARTIAGQGTPRIVIHESDACQGNITGWGCEDCEDDACEHECHLSEPEPRPDVPDEAVKAVAEQLLSDYDAEFDAGHLSRKDFTGQARKLIEVASPHIREQVAAELEALRDGVENKDTPYNEAFIHALDCAVRAVRREAG